MICCRSAQNTSCHGGTPLVSATKIQCRRPGAKYPMSFPKPREDRPHEMFFPTSQFWPRSRAVPAGRRAHVRVKLFERGSISWLQLVAGWLGWSILWTRKLDWCPVIIKQPLKRLVGLDLDLDLPCSLQRVNGTSP